MHGMAGIISPLWTHDCTEKNSPKQRLTSSPFCWKRPEWTTSVATTAVVLHMASYRRGEIILLTTSFCVLHLRKASHALVSSPCLLAVEVKVCQKGSHTANETDPTNNTVILMTQSWLSKKFTILAFDQPMHNLTN